MGQTCCRSDVDRSIDSNIIYADADGHKKIALHQSDTYGKHMIGSSFIISDDMKQIKPTVKPLNIVNSKKIDKQQEDSQKKIKVAQIRKNLKDL